MPDLDFEIRGAAAVTYSVTPLLAFRVAISTTPPGAVIHTVALRAQIQFEVARRLYTAEEQENLHDLFGESSRWSQTLRNMLWTHVSVIVPTFTGQTVAELNVPCTFDFNVAATKYFHGLAGGEIPLLFLFSGTVFYENEHGLLQAAPISWVKEASFPLPVQTWRTMIDVYYPNTAWLTLRRDVFQRLYEYKTRGGIFTWEQAIERALDAATEPAKEPASR